MEMPYVFYTCVILFHMEFFRTIYPGRKWGNCRLRNG